VSAAPEMLSNAERRVLSDRLRRIVAMCDAGCARADIRQAVAFTAYAVEEPAWDGLANKPTNLEAA
jgi:hypothetical protein